MINFKKALIYIMILVIIMVEAAEISKSYAYAIPNDLSKGTPIKIGVFLDNSNAMYMSIIKQNLERIEKENENSVKFTFFDAKDNQIIQNESIEKALTVRV